MIMVFLEGLFRRNRRYKVQDSGTLLLALGRKRGFSDQNRDPMLAWMVFKEFCLEYHFQCEDDAVLWEIGPYGRTAGGEPCFRWHLVRQFTEGPGEDEDMSQVHLDLTFSKEPEEGRRATLWSYDFGGDLNAFFDAVEARPDFPLPKGTVVRVAMIGLEKV